MKARLELESKRVDDRKRERQAAAMHVNVRIVTSADLKQGEVAKWAKKSDCGRRLPVNV